MKKILVIQQKMIGDVLVSSIICNNLKKADPTSQIHYMVYSSTTPVLEGNPYIDKLILFTEEQRKSKLTFFKFIMSVRKERYDIIIDAYSKIESWLTVFFSGARQKISYQKKGRSFLYTHNVKILHQPKSNLGLTIERRLSLLNPLNLEIELDPIPKLYVSNKEKQFAKKLLKDQKVDSNKKLVMISIIGSSALKTYPLAYMSNIVDFIADYMDVNMLFNYIPSQIKEAKTIYHGCKTSTKKQIYFDVLGNNIREYIALMNECDLIIGNDGGAINIAKSLNKPSFIIFSPWIEKQMWATFEDGKFHKSVHLEDYKPAIFKEKSVKEIKRDSLGLYQQFKPDLIYNTLKSFLDFNLSTRAKTLNIVNLIRQTKNSKREQLSALVITFNEAENIREVLINLSFADEIIVVDSFSTDATAHIISKEFQNVKFIQNKFLNYSDQRNFALSQTSNDWVLFIDADERISNSLKDEIINVLKDLKNNVAYEMYRQIYFNDKLLKFSGFQTDKVYRLFNKKFVRYNKEKFVHETLVINGKTACLKNKLEHYSFKNYQVYKDKMKNYAQLRAQELYINKLRPNFYHFNIKPIYRFLYHFIIRLGFLDGKKGYIIAILNAYGVKQRYIELQKLFRPRK